MIHSGLEPELIAGQVYQEANVVPTRAANLWFARRSIFVEAGGKLAGRRRRLAAAGATAPARKARAWWARASRLRARPLVCFDCEAFAKAGAADMRRRWRARH